MMGIPEQEKNARSNAGQIARLRAKKRPAPRFGGGNPVRRQAMKLGQGHDEFDNPTGEKPSGGSSNQKVPGSGSPRTQPDFRQQALRKKIDSLKNKSAKPLPKNGGPPKSIQPPGGGADLMRYKR